MYKKPSMFIIRKADVQRMKAMADSFGACFASGACAGNIDRAGLCNSTTNDNGGKYSHY